MGNFFKWLFGFVSWDVVARLLQIALASVGAWLIAKGWASEDLVTKGIAWIIEIAAWIWANWHGTSSGRRTLIARAFGKPPPVVKKVEGKKT
jgi:hypothetical protein